MLLGIPTGGQIAINASRAEQSTFWAGFIQNDWRVTRRLTVNIGLRYEYEGAITERHNRSIREFDFGVDSPIAAQAKGKLRQEPYAGAARKPVSASWEACCLPVCKRSTQRTVE